jgi:hypothetical protein
MYAEEAHRREHLLPVPQRAHAQELLPVHSCKPSVVTLTLDVDNLRAQQHVVSAAGGHDDAARRRTTEVVQQGLHRGRTDALLPPLVDALHSRQQLLGLHRLEQVIRRAHSEGLHCVAVVGCYEHHFAVAFSWQRAQECKPILPGHLHVQEHKVGAHLRDKHPRLRC